MFISQRDAQQQQINAFFFVSNQAAVWCSRHASSFREVCVCLFGDTSIIETKSNVLFHVALSFIYGDVGMCFHERALVIEPLKDALAPFPILFFFIVEQWQKQNERINEWLKNEWMNMIYENIIENMKRTLNTNEIDILLSILIWFQFGSGAIAFFRLLVWLTDGLSVWRNTANQIVWNFEQLFKWLKATITTANKIH